MNKMIYQILNTTAIAIITVITIFAITPLITLTSDVDDSETVLTFVKHLYQ